MSKGISAAPTSSLAINFLVIHNCVYNPLFGKNKYKIPCALLGKSQIDTLRTVWNYMEICVTNINCVISVMKSLLLNLKR